MSVTIETTDELLTVLKKMNLKVASVDELRQLLASINASYDPDAARQKTGRQIATIVPGAMAGAAAVASFMLLPDGSTPFTLGSLAVIWGCVAVVSTAAVLAGALLSGVRRSRAMPDTSPDRPMSRVEPMGTHIIQELPT